MRSILQKIRNFFRSKNETAETEQVETKEPVQKSKPKKRRKQNYNSIYLYYTAHDRLYFKTRKGKRYLAITASEAIRIVQLLQKGYDLNHIYMSISFYHDIGISTVEQWIAQYHRGLMDIALSWICDNHIDNINIPKKDILKRK